MEDVRCWACHFGGSSAIDCGISRLEGGLRRKGFCMIAGFGSRVQSRDKVR